jgi:hypothetical protein
MIELKKFTYTPILGWSLSRYDKFVWCKRRYYYEYYSKYDQEYPIHKIDKLKRLTSVPLEIGNLVHDIIADILRRLLKSERKIDKIRLFVYIQKKTEQACTDKIFQEVYYKETNSISIDKILPEVKVCIDNFITSKRWVYIFTEAISKKSDWIIEPPGYGETRIEGLKAYCKVDFLFPLNDSILVLDWKTGKADEVKHRNQLIGYAFWASLNYDKPSSQIIPIVAYLRPDYREDKVQVSESDIQEFVKRVRSQTEEMYSYCQNVEENIPKNKNLFNKTSNQNLCNFCNFRELCF